MGQSLGLRPATSGIGDGDAFFGVEAVDDGGGDDQFAVAGVEGFVIDFLVFEVFGDDAQGVGFDAGIDILGNEDGVLGRTV